MFLHHPDFRGVEYDGEGVWDAEGGGSKFIMNIVFDKLHHAPRTVLALYKYGPMKSHRII